MCELWIVLIRYTFVRIGYYDYYAVVKIHCKMSFFWQFSLTVTLNNTKWRKHTSTYLGEANTEKREHFNHYFYSFHKAGILLPWVWMSVWMYRERAITALLIQLDLTSEEQFVSSWSKSAGKTFV